MELLISLVQISLEGLTVKRTMNSKKDLLSLVFIIANIFDEALAMVNVVSCGEGDCRGWKVVCCQWCYLAFFRCFIGKYGESTLVGDACTVKFLTYPSSYYSAIWKYCAMFHAEICNLSHVCTSKNLCDDWSMLRSHMHGELFPVSIKESIL